MFGNIPHLEYVGASLVAQTVKNLPAMWDTQVQPWVWKIPWRGEWQLTSVFLPGELHEQRRLVGYTPWGCKESDMTQRLSVECYPIVA